MAGHDPLDATSLDISAQNIDFKDMDGSVFSGMRIGVPQEYFTSGIQVDVEKKVREAILLIESFGAEILPVSLPHTEYRAASLLLNCTSRSFGKSCPL